ncbi:hypothetical protein [Glycomyces tenuis]|uniref:hypothetical protein n=1 Tax=Glycomyces tenuis TaxID=58116 RepID=UPI00042111C7|nr:hypothetical protein [Glycomyces tenuis]
MDSPRTDPTETTNHGDRIADMYWIAWAPWLCDIDAQRAPELSAHRDGHAWWKHERIGFTVEHVDIPDLAWSLADLCCSLWPHRPFEQLFPHPPPFPDLQRLLTATHGLSGAGLREEGIEDFSDLATRDVPDLFNAQGWGEWRVRRLIAAVIEMSLHDPRAVPVGWPGTSPSEPMAVAEPASGPRPALRQTVLDGPASVTNRIAIILDWKSSS